MTGKGEKKILKTWGWEGCWTVGIGRDRLDLKVVYHKSLSFCAEKTISLCFYIKKENLCFPVFSTPKSYGSSIGIIVRGV